jgi:hypothetical protein
VFSVPHGRIVAWCLLLLCKFPTDAGFEASIPSSGIEESAMVGNSTSGAAATDLEK